MNSTKHVLSPFSPVQGKHTDLLLVVKKIATETHSFFSFSLLVVKIRSGLGTDRHGSCTHFSTTLGHKKQAKQLQKCGWWMGGIALFLAQMSVKYKKHRTTGQPGVVGRLKLEKGRK